LEEASEIVVRIRSLLAHRSPQLPNKNNWKTNSIDGASQEFLWTLSEESIQNVTKNPKQFVKDFVHATFKNAQGYVDALESKEIDQWIDTIQTTIEQRSKVDVHDVIASINRNVNNLSTNVLSNFVDWMQKKKTFSDHQVSHIQQINQQVNSLIEFVDILMKEETSSPKQSEKVQPQSEQKEQTPKQPHQN